ncbi:hypothetical protein KJ780_01970, partial [Candidatus Micrarchaeota archaeon]|nr:hypothetical protein [Candidatus Micrarchaeota archaeon]
MKNKPGSEKIEKRPPKCMKELLLFPLPKLKALPEPIMQPISEQEKTRIISNFNEFRDFRNSTRKLEESVAKLLDTLSSLDKADAKEIAAGIMFDLAIGDFSSAILRKTNEVIAAKGLHCIPEDVISSPDCCHAVISFYVSNPPDRFDDILIRSFICCRATNRKTQDKLRYETLFIHGSCFPRGSKKLMDAIIDSTTLGYSEREKWLSDLSSPNPYFMIYVFRRLGDCAISNAVMNRVVR